LNTRSKIRKKQRKIKGLNCKKDLQKKWDGKKEKKREDIHLLEAPEMRVLRKFINAVCRSA